MTKLHLEIKGPPGNISVPTFLIVIQNSLKVLHELDAAISAKPEGSLDWVVDDLTSGSLIMEVGSRTRLEDANFGPRVSNAFVTSFALIQDMGITPPYLSSSGMQRIERMLSAIGRNGATGLLFSHADTQVNVTTQAVVNVRQLLKVRYRSIGSIEGRLEMISVHREPRFIVYDEQTRKAVTCRFEAERFLERAKDALGHRVNVTGLISANTKGEVLSIRVDGLRTLRSRAALPTTVDLAGSDPEFTSDMSTDDYLKNLREHHRSMQLG